MEPLLKAGVADERTVLQLQLRHLRTAALRLRNTIRPDEQPFLFLLKNQVSKLEKQLYPNWIVRVLHQLKDRLFDGPKFLKQQEEQRVTNMENLKVQLKETGFGSINGRLEQHLDADQRAVTIPLNCGIGEDRKVLFDLKFEKDAFENFQLHGVHTQLRQQGKTVRQYDFKLKDWPGLGVGHVIQLLQGHALKQSFTNAAGQTKDRWVELTSDGVQHYAPEKSFNLQKAVSEHAGLSGSAPELIQYLEGGQRVPTYWRSGRHHVSISVQADPANQSLKFFDAKGMPITVKALNEEINKQKSQYKAPAQQERQMRRSHHNGISR